VAKVEWHPGELYRRLGFIVTNLGRPAEGVVSLYDQHGAAERYIKARAAQFPATGRLRKMDTDFDEGRTLSHAITQALNPEMCLRYQRSDRYYSRGVLVR